MAVVDFIEVAVVRLADSPWLRYVEGLPSLSGVWDWEQVHALPTMSAGDGRVMYIKIELNLLRNFATVSTNIFR